MKPPLVFTAGLALGALAVWAVLRPPAPGNAEPRPGSSASVTVAAPAPALVLPPLLAGAEADEALDAYLALAPLESKAPEAEIAERLGRLRALLTVLPPDHFTRLLDALALRDGGAETRLRRVAFEIWTEQDAPAAARWALALVPRKGFDAAARARYTTQAALAWARSDFAAAYSWAGATGETALALGIRSRLLGQLAATDPLQALALSAQGDADFVRASQRAVFDAWAERDPAAALQSLGAPLLETRDNAWRVQQALAKWIAREPSAGLDWALARHATSDDSSTRSPLLSIGWALAQTPGASAPVLDILHRRHDIPDRASTIRNLLGALANKDPAAAGAWLDTLPDAAERSDYITRSLGYLHEKPDAFLALARRLPASSDRDDKIVAHLASWADRDPDAALAWMSGNKDPALAAAAPRLEGLLIGQLAATDPAAALARWQTLPATAQIPSVAAGIATHWAKSDPAAATAWFIQQLPAQPADNPAHHEAYFQLQNIAAAWVRRDLPAYLAWAQQLPATIHRDFAFGALSSLWWNYSGVSDDPPPRAAFAEQLARIQDAAIRERALDSHLEAWLRSDVHAARAWIVATEALSPEAAARILTRSESHR